MVKRWVSIRSARKLHALKEGYQKRVKKHRGHDKLPYHM